MFCWENEQLNVKNREELRKISLLREFHSSVSDRTKFHFRSSSNNTAIVKA